MNGKAARKDVAGAVEPREDGKARLRLTITVSYDLNGQSASDMERHLRQTADRLADEGLLSGETKADVTEWDAKVEELR